MLSECSRCHGTAKLTSDLKSFITSGVQLRSYLEEIVVAPVWKTENTAVGICCADHATPSIRKSWY
jgi:hypothetical protein